MLQNPTYKAVSGITFGTANGRMVLMARIWTEPFQEGRHSVPIEYWGSLDAHRRAPTLCPRNVLMVSVASFTFQFFTVQQLGDCISYFEQKIHPTSRLPLAGDVDHWEMQRWFERLPMYLFEESKRSKVLRALNEAMPLAKAQLPEEQCIRLDTAGRRRANY